MSGRPVPRGLRGVNPPRDRILCRRRRGRVGHGPTASSPANAFFLVRGSHGRIIYEELGLIAGAIYLLGRRAEVFAFYSNKAWCHISIGNDTAECGKCCTAPLRLQ